MKNQFSYLCIIMLLFVACNKDKSEYELLEGPASLGGVCPTFYFILRDKSGNILLENANKNVPKLYFFDKGKKVFNADFLIERQSKNDLAWSKLSGNECVQSNLGFNEVLSDNTIYKIYAENGIDEFYLEWLGKDVGKINFSTVKDGGKTLVKVLYNDKLIKSSKLPCLSLYIFEQN